MRTGTLEIAGGLVLGLMLFTAAMVGAIAFRQFTRTQAATPLLSNEAGAN